jgi:hypothetical protein
MIHEAEQYLKDNKPGQLYVRYRGEKRKLFITKDGTICMVSKGRRNRGCPFSDWEGITKSYFPKPEGENDRNLVEKYRREASKATFTNPFIRDCLKADASKSLYENHITTGNAIDGKIITLSSVRNTVGSYEMLQFERAVKYGLNYRSCRFPFRGYEATLEVAAIQHSCDTRKAGDVYGYLSVEYKGYGNGYYYLLINDENFIGYEVD